MTLLTMTLRLYCNSTWGGSFAICRFGDDIYYEISVSNAYNLHNFCLLCIQHYVHIPYSNVLELQRRVLKTEAAVQYKKDENAGLRLQVEQYEKKWQQSEAKMKSLEQMWQDQLTSIQVSYTNWNSCSSQSNSFCHSSIWFRFQFIYVF